MTVPGVGPRNAKIVIIGEAPGQEEEFSGIPFVGGSGKLLNQMLENAGIDRNECYLTNVMKVRPPGNDFGVFYVDDKRRQPSPALQAGIADLLDEVRRVRPNVVIPLGSEALRAITGNKTSIEKWRGSIINSEVGKCVPTYHPAYVLRQYISRSTVELDLRRAWAESTSPTIHLEHFNFDIAPSFDKVMAFLHTTPALVAFDIETDTHIRCLGIADGANHAICIPFTYNPNQMLVGDGVLRLGPPAERNSYWTPDQEWEILEALDRFFLKPSIAKVAQNFPFDSLLLAKEFGLDTSVNMVMDTMVAQHTCYSELPKGLDYLGSVYTRIPYWCDFDNSNDRQLWTYNCYDCVVTWQCTPMLEKELEDLRTKEFYHNHVNNTVLAAARTESRGVLIDQVARGPILQQTKEELSAIGKQIIEGTGGLITNPNSDKQVRDYFYNHLKVPPILHHKTRAPTMDKNARESLGIKYPQLEPLLDLLDTYSTKATLIENFLDRPLGSDGAIRTHYSVAGTVTGRMASKAPLFEVGTNLQNIPRGAFRRLFIPRPGFEFIKADLGQAEFRVVCWLANIRRFIEKYTEDPHWDVFRQLIGPLIFNCTPEQLTKEQRTTSKNGAYGGNYHMMYKTAARTYHLNINVAKLVLDRYRSIVPEVPLWWKEVENEVTRTRMHTSALGRVRLFLDRIGDDLFRSAYSHYAQNVVADIINRAWYLSDTIFPEDECHAVLQVHDELVWECRPELTPVYAEKARRLMEYSIRFPHVPEPMVIPAEVSHGPNWFDQTEIKEAK